MNIVLLIVFSPIVFLFVRFCYLYHKWRRAKNSWRKENAQVIQVRDEERSFDRHTRTIKVITLEYEVEGNTYTSDLDEDDALFAEQNVGSADASTIFPVYVDPQNPQKIMAPVSGCGVFFVSSVLVFCVMISLLLLLPFFLSNSKDEYPSKTKVAAQSGNYDAVVQFYTSGGDINIQDESGNTLLMIAAANNHEQICKMLVIAGARVNLHSAMGQTALDMAIIQELEPIVALLRKSGAKTADELKGNL